MFWLDVDFESGNNTVHRANCVHSAPENNPFKGDNELREKGGWFSFSTVGKAVRYVKVNKLSGTTGHYKFCQPIKAMAPEPRAALGLKAHATGCAACGKYSTGQESKTETVEITDAKIIASRLRRKLFGRR
jgi:hypothetical protein